MRQALDVVSEFTADVPPDVAALRLMRWALADWLAQAEVEPSASEALILATHEAAANALQHAGASVNVTVSRAGDEVTVVVRNVGCWKETDGNEYRGRGLPLMHGLMSSVDIASGDGVSIVQMRLRL